jgi:tRNA threonylcarbamoyladenosine biosynthesis protein TsaE
MAHDMVSATSRTFVSRSSAGTENLGEQLGRALRSPVLIALDGELGAGKTCFVRGLAAGLDVRDTISSPTYALLQTYAGRLDLHHLDAWMEGRERAFLTDGGLDWVGESGVTVIEWAERVADVLPRPILSVKIEVIGTEERRIVIGVLTGDRTTTGAAGLLGELHAAISSLRADTDVEIVTSDRPRRRDVDARSRED